MTRALVAKLIGGAGTGKTREMMATMESAKDRLGGSPFSVGFSSFTRAARAEAVSRAAEAWQVPDEVLSKQGWFRTVHSIAYTQLGVESGQLLTDNKESIAWIADALGVPIGAVSDDEANTTRYVGDQVAAAALNCWQLSRARMEPLKQVVRTLATITGESLPWATVKQYVERFERAKMDDDRVDFTDLLARFGGVRFSVEGVENVEPEGDVPEEVKAWVFDEQQDASALVHRCCERLAAGENVKWVYLSGDPMQSIFGFGGSDSRHFMSWEADKTRIMDRTWRCPSPVLKLGESCLKRMRQGYFDRGISPADHEGAVEFGGHAGACVRMIDPNEQTLIIARCNYQLDAYIEHLRKVGLPFLRLKAKAGSSALTACKALWQIEHGEPVSGDEMAAAIGKLPATGNMVRGTKTAWQSREMVRQWDVVFPEQLPEIGLKESLIERIKAGGWADLVPGGKHWRNSAEKYGPEKATEPNIRIGTIHASKGMEADCVVMSTETTQKIDESQMRSDERHDEERRVEYVGITRARRRLILGRNPESQYRMRVSV
jgi:superfamily I DNA/RNA helicase